MEKIPAEFFEDAIKDLSEILDELRRISPDKPSTLLPDFSQKLFRTLHTIKGSAQTFGLDAQAKLAHDTETLLERLKTEQVIWNAESANALMNAIEGIKNDFVLISENKEPLDPEVSPEVSKELALFLRTSAPVDQNSDLPDNFPVEFLAEFLRALSRQEIVTLSFAWSAGKEILILEFGIDQNEFATRFKQIRKTLEDKAQIIAVAPGQSVENTASFRFLVAAEKSEQLIEVLRQFSGRVLFQKQTKTAGEDTRPDENIMEKLGEELVEAVLHGKKAAAVLGKEVKFIQKGDPVQIPRQYSKIVSMILLHLVRNAVDHGIEFPLERAAFKKPRQGTVELSIRSTEKNFLITVCDDGRGIENLTKNAVEIFSPGFSTAIFVTELSGRGVGLDVVRDAVQKANGNVKVDSKPGHGTTFQIELPLK